jgi:hypothetical protein
MQYRLPARVGRGFDMLGLGAAGKIKPVELGYERRGSVTVIKANVRQGRLETDEPIDLPDGTELLIPLATAEDKDRSPTREEIAAALAAMDEIESFSWTEQERADWHADRKARRDLEKAGFQQEAEKLRSIWE